jgi:hypothetical protein
VFFKIKYSVWAGDGESFFRKQASKILSKTTMENGGQIFPPLHFPAPQEQTKHALKRQKFKPSTHNGQD